MQPTSSGLNTPPQIDRNAPPNRVTSDDSAATIRVDAPAESSSFIQAPHVTIGTSGTRPGRVRGERPKPIGPSSVEDAAFDGDHLGECVHRESFPESAESASPQVRETLDNSDTSHELNWSVLHAEDISRILDQRMFEVERRERLLNRRANQISQQERMFRLWANDVRQELERKRRELQQLESELIQRSHDVRWLLVHGDQFDSGDHGSPTSHRYDDFDMRPAASPTPQSRVVPQKVNASLEEEIQSQIRELEFGSSNDGMRRPNR